MRSETKDIFSDTVQGLMSNSTIKKHTNKTIQKQKNITFSLSQESRDLIEKTWFKLRQENPKVTKTSLVEAAIKRTLPVLKV